jgi:acyl-[acyl-carrier-protein]-phospholipid O-acyltransferase/long-chain-fatty-acid--[acyl-carrier-protein] ligase
MLATACERLPASTYSSARLLHQARYSSRVNAVTTGFEPPAAGWHDTGDIVAVDRDGFITIKGRAKRFAKIAGEMVSLAAIESLAAECWPDSASAVVAMPDPRKGERLVLVTQKVDASRARFSDLCKI